MWLDRYVSLMCKLSAVIKYRQSQYTAFDNFKKQWAPFLQYCSQEKQDFVKLPLILEML